jgi:hypothetical protein
MYVAVPLSWRIAGLTLLCIYMRKVVLIVVFGLYNDGPASREDAAVHAELVGFEEEAAKDWNDSQILAIGEMHDGRCGSHVC